MTGLTWEEAPIGKQHDRAAFDCGDADLNLFCKNLRGRIMKAAAQNASSRFLPIRRRAFSASTR